MKRREAIAGAAAAVLVPVVGLGGATPLTADEAAVLDVLARSWKGSPLRLTEPVVAANAGLTPPDARAALDELARKGHARRSESGGYWQRVET